MDIIKFTLCIGFDDFDGLFPNGLMTVLQLQMLVHGMVAHYTNFETAIFHGRWPIAVVRKLKKEIGLHHGMRITLINFLSKDYGGEKDPQQEHGYF